MFHFHLFATLQHPLLHILVLFVLRCTVVIVQLLLPSHVQLFATQWIAAPQASLSLTILQSFPKWDLNGVLKCAWWAREWEGWLFYTIRFFLSISFLKYIKSQCLDLKPEGPSVFSEPMPHSGQNKCHYLPAGGEGATLIPPSHRFVLEECWGCSPSIPPPLSWAKTG